MEINVGGENFFFFLENKIDERGINKRNKPDADIYIFTEKVL